MSNKLIRKISDTLQARNLKFCIDYADSNNISGWIVCLKKHDSPVLVELQHEGKVISSTHANLPREDVLEAGIGNGYCGFHFDSQKLDINLPTASFDLYAAGKKLNKDPIFVKFEIQPSKLKKQRMVFLEGVKQEINEITKQIGQYNMKKSLPEDNIAGAFNVSVERIAELTVRLSTIEKTLVDILADK